jgi:hypothetical protein
LALKSSRRTRQLQILGIEQSTPNQCSTITSSPWDFG